MSSDVLIVYCTLPRPDDADDPAQAIGATLARTLVAERLAACVNLIPAVRSIYRWKGEVCDDGEELAIIKTTADRFEALRARIVQLHPYECPEVVAFPVTRGHTAYLAWVDQMTAPGDE